MTIPTCAHVYLKVTYQIYTRGLPLITYAPRGRGGGGAHVSYFHIIAYYMLKLGEGVHSSMENCVRTYWKAPKQIGVRDHRNIYK